MGSSIWQPLLLTLLGAAGTALGGLMVVLQPQMNFKRLGILQGLAAGLMLSISLIDLLPEAAEEIGFVAANLCFYAGVAFFACIITFIPEPDALFATEQEFAQQQQKQQDAQQPLAKSSNNSSKGLFAEEGVQRVCGATAAGTSGANGSSAVLQRPADASALAQLRARRRSNNAASCAALPAPAALDVSPPGYAPQQPPHCSPRSPASSTDSSADLQVLLREGGGPSTDDSQKHKQQLLMSGIVTAVGIALHNFPEGVAVFLASHKSTAVGVSLACAIALHNIPEGVAVALPVYFATGSRLRGLQTAVLSGLAEPLAVLMLGCLFPFLQLNKHVVDGMLAGVGGIMAFLAFHELLPLSMQHAGKPWAVASLFGGMGLMSVTLHWLNTHVLAGLH